MLKKITDCGIKKEQDDYTQTRSENDIGAGAGFNAAQIQTGEEQRINYKPDLHGKAVKQPQIDGSFTTPDHANNWIHYVIEHHAPAGEIARRRMNFATDISVGRAGAGISIGHSSIAKRSEQHRHHSDQNERDHVAVGFVVGHAEQWHRGRRLNQDDAIQHQSGQSEGAFQARAR